MRIYFRLYLSVPKKGENIQMGVDWYHMVSTGNLIMGCLRFSSRVCTVTIRII